VCLTCCNARAWRTRITTDEEIEAAVNTPAADHAGAKLRGEFISAAQEARS